MIAEEIKNIKSGKNDLRKFGITMSFAFALLGGFFWWRGKNFYLYFLSLSIAFIFFGTIIPFSLKPLHKIWMSLAVIMSWFMTRVILSILLYLGFTPIGFLSRLFGKDFLGIKFDRNNSNSYWIPKERRKLERIDYEKQF